MPNDETLNILNDAARSIIGFCRVTNASVFKMIGDNPDEDTEEPEPVWGIFASTDPELIKRFAEIAQSYESQKEFEHTVNVTFHPGRKVEGHED